MLFAFGSDELRIRISTTFLGLKRPELVVAEAALNIPTHLQIESIVVSGEATYVRGRLYSGEFWREAGRLSCKN